MFKIYSSSAGSGKTYTLTKEYLKLALHPSNDRYYRHILAVTFTNAAASEMKTRIMDTLNRFAGPDETPPMLADIVGELYPETSGNPVLYAQQSAAVRTRSRAVFQKILHGYSDFSVMTIDSFMARLAASFTDELGLPFGFETRLDTDLLTGAIDRVLARVSRKGEERLTQILENYYREHAEDGKGWSSLPERIRETARDLVNEQSYQALATVSHLTLQDWFTIRKQLQAYVRERNAEMRSMAAGGLKTIQSEGLTAGDFYQSTKGIYAYFENRATRDDKLWETPNAFVRTTVHDNKWAGGKISRTDRDRLNAISDELTARYGQMEAFREQAGPRVILYKLLIGQLYNLSLLHEIKGELDTLLRQNNQVHISEFNRKVIEIVARDPIPFIFERLGEKYNHILIDEFQDTSKLQFANLLPLIDNALASNHFNLVVGDIKQAIYRFRGGDMDLLLKLSQGQARQLSGLLGSDNPFLEDRLLQLDRRYDLARLKINRRSHQEITRFNNLFFSYLSAIEELRNELSTAVYDDSFQQEIGTQAAPGGHIQINFFDKDEPDGEQPDAQGRYVLGLIRQLRAEGYSWRDLAILCREKKQARRLAEWLQEAGCPLISDDSLLLSNAGSIHLLIGFIQVLYTPSKSYLRLETVLLFHQLTGRPLPAGDAFEPFLQMCRKPDITSFTVYFQQFDISLDGIKLQQSGLYELCEQLIACLGLFDLRRENNYLFRFLDEVLNFTTTRTSHLGDFLNWWEVSGQNSAIAIPPDTDAIRITTIHKSKGLEYPVVLVPYAQWSAAPKPQSRLWADLSALDYPELVAHTAEKRLVSAAVAIKKELADTPLRAQYQEEADRVLLENMNLLYVAFTRPVQRLYVLALLPAPPGPGKSPAPTVNTWLRSFLVSLGRWQDEQSTYIIAQEDRPCFQASPQENHSAWLIGKPIVNRQAAAYNLKRNAGRLFDTETFEKKQDFYQKLKYTLVRLKEKQALDATLVQLVHSGILSEEDLPLLRDAVQQLLQHERISTVFSPEAVTLLPNELILPGGALLQADRVVCSPDGQCSLINFISEPQDTLAPPAMRNLLNAYQTAGFINPEGILVYLHNREVLVVSPGVRQN